VDVETSLDQAYALLSGGSSAVIATRGDRPVGVVTKLDVLEHLTHRPAPRG
jgi:predicted transcriptional regulator